MIENLPEDFTTLYICVEAGILHTFAHETLGRVLLDLAHRRIHGYRVLLGLDAAVNTY